MIGHERKMVNGKRNDFNDVLGSQLLYERNALEYYIDQTIKQENA